MSVYKVITNYYTEIMDFLNQNAKKHKGIDNYLKALDGDQVLQVGLINKLSDTLVRLNIMYNNNISFWNEKIKTQNGLLILAVIGIILSFMAVVAMLVYKFKQMKILYDGKKPPFDELLKAILSHIIAYLICFSILLIWIININSMKKLYEGEKQKFSSEMKAKINSSFDCGYLQYIFYESGNNKATDLFITLGQTNRKMRLKVPPEFKSYVGNESLVYQDFGDAIKNAMNKFYSRGYSTIHRMFVLSSPYNTLKEVNEIMNFYHLHTLLDEEMYDAPARSPEDMHAFLLENFVPLMIQAKEVNYTETVDSIANSAIEQRILLSMYQEYLTKTSADTRRTKDTSFYRDILASVHAESTGIYDEEKIKQLVVNLAITSSAADKDPLVNKLKAITTNFDKDDVFSSIMTLNAAYYSSEYYNDLLSEVDKAVRVKTSISKKNDGQKRFVDFAAFKKDIDSLRLKDLVDGLNIKYYNGLITEFYRNISESVNANAANLSNIYYLTAKNQKIMRLTIVMVTIVVALMYVYYISFIMKDKYKELKEEEAKQISAVKNPVEKEAIIREFAHKNVNYWFTTVVPGFVIVFVICILFSYAKKFENINSFNQDMVEANTTLLRNSLQDLKSFVEDLPGATTAKIGSVPAIKDTDKQRLFDLMKDVVVKFDKCNYILESQKSKMPFPYTEIVVNGFMILVIVLVLFYLYAQINPIKRIFDIKSLNSYIEQLKYASAKDFENLKATTEFLQNCHRDNMNSITFTMKIIFFIFIIMFLMFYSSKVVSSSAEFKSGLYNSVYFTDNMCYG
jgi:hypothetical protein